MDHIVHATTLVWYGCTELKHYRLAECCFAFLFCYSSDITILVNQQNFFQMNRGLEAISPKSGTSVQSKVHNYPASCSRPWLCTVHWLEPACFRTCSRSFNRYSSRVSPVCTPPMNGIKVLMVKNKFIIQH